MGVVTSTICLRSIKSSLPPTYPLRHSCDKLFQALYCSAIKLWKAGRGLGTRLGRLTVFRLVSYPDPSQKSGKKVWCSERLFLSHEAGSNDIKNVIIAFPHALHAACKMIASVRLLCQCPTASLPRSSICL